MNKICFIAVLVLFMFSPSYADINKLDPVFCAYLSDSIGEEFPLFPVSAKILFNENFRKETEGIINFEDVFLKNKIGETGVIVKGESSTAALYLNEMIIINDSIVTGFADNQSIIEMSMLPEIDFIELSKPMFQSADSGAYYTRISTMNFYGYTGKNVILGFIDSEFSPGLDCFYDGERNNFLKVWNQKAERLLPPSGYYYGEELDSADYKTYQIEDNTGHGTSLLSLLVAKNTVDGIVADANVLGVSCELSIKNVIDGLKYIEESALSLNKPFAVVLPLNHYWGTHGGGGLLEEVINEMFADHKQKRGISVPVGNLGNMFIHASAYVSGTDTSAGITDNPFVLAQAVLDYNLDLDIIYSSPVLVRFILKNENGLWKSNWIDIESEEVGYLNNNSSFIGFALNKTKKNLHVVLQQSNHTLLGIEFSSKDSYSEIDCYAAQGGYFITDSDYPNMIKGDRKMTIASPALSPQVISSASYVSRRKITNSLISPDTLFHKLQWSGRSDEDIIKPDLFSPGKYIFAIGLNRWGIPVNDTLSAFQGTSYSSAYTGAALIQLLQSDTFLNVNELYSQLKTGADVIPDDIDAVDNSSSYGFLNVYNSLKSQTVKSMSCDVSISLFADTMLAIELMNKNFSIVRIQKNNSEKSLEIRNRYLAIDKNPYLGKNIYVLYLKDKNGNILTASESFNFSSKQNFSPIVYFDLTGRRTNKRFFKQGVLFEKQNDKVRKIVKF